MDRCLAGSVVVVSYLATTARMAETQAATVSSLSSSAFMNQLLPPVVTWNAAHPTPAPAAQPPSSSSTILLLQVSGLPACLSPFLVENSMTVESAASVMRFLSLASSLAALYMRLDPSSTKYRLR